MKRGVEWMKELGLGFFQSCRNRGNVGCVSVLRWCM